MLNKYIVNSRSNTPILLIINAIIAIYSGSAYANGLGISPSVVVAGLYNAPPMHGAQSVGQAQPVDPYQNEGAPPANTNGYSAKLAGLSVTIWNPIITGKVPLVIFSHGINGCSTQSTFLTKKMADSGYLVIAPNHKDAKCTSGAFNAPDVKFGDANAWNDTTYVDRKQDIQNILLELKINSTWKNRIDWNKVSLAGHSLGGYTVLGLGGAWPSWKTGGIKAILALSPYCEPYIIKGNLSGINAAIMYQGGTKDIGVTPYIKKPGGAYDKSPTPTYFVEFNGAGHFAFTDAVPEFQKDINYYSLAFLDAYVKNDPAAFKLLQKRLPSVSEIRKK